MVVPHMLFPLQGVPLPPCFVLSWPPCRCVHHLPGGVSHSPACRALYMPSQVLRSLHSHQDLARGNGDPGPLTAGQGRAILGRRLPPNRGMCCGRVGAPNACVLGGAGEGGWWLFSCLFCVDGGDPSFSFLTSPASKLEGSVAEIHQRRPGACGVRGHHDRSRWKPQVQIQGTGPGRWR